MMEIECPGWPAHWLNAWLAAVGATVLDTRLRLRWTGSATPVPVLSATEIHPGEALVESWPDAAKLMDIPIAKDWKGAGVLPRKVTVHAFQERARAARGHPQAWALSSTITDLCVDRNGEVLHAPFDPPGPGTIKWLHYRLRKVHAHVQVTDISDSLQGRANRVNDNGLGFDQSRLGSLSDKTSRWVDPVVEVLAFFALSLLPVRGNGSDLRLSGNVRMQRRQRGWRPIPTDSRYSSFAWPVWHQALDRDGIDALLDAWNPNSRNRQIDWQRLGIHAGWRSVNYTRLASADVTTAFGSERL